MFNYFPLFFGHFSLFGQGEGSICHQTRRQPHVTTTVFASSPYMHWCNNVVSVLNVNYTQTTWSYSRRGERLLLPSSSVIISATLAGLGARTLLVGFLGDVANSGSDNRHHTCSRCARCEVSQQAIKHGAFLGFKKKNAMRRQVFHQIWGVTSFDSITVSA